ncbi:MAG: hypothetical protein JNJ46_17500 [Myxococcales bacterium]|nr:hypothetical protein [Myxococcales bacterium]
MKRSAQRPLCRGLRRAWLAWWAGLALATGIVPSWAQTGVRSGPSTLNEAVEKHMVQAAKQQRLAPLARDAALGEAARLLASRRGCEVPQHALIQAALWQSGIIEPVHRLLLTRYATAVPSDLLDGLPQQLHTALSSRGGGSGPGKWTRYGFFAQPYDAEMSCGVLIILETFVKLSPLPRSQPLAGPPLRVAGSLSPPYKKPRLMITAPTGETTALAIESPPRKSGDSEGFVASFGCREPGRYQLEVLGEDRAGPTVLANFPLYCGQNPPDVSALLAASAESNTSSGKAPTDWQCNGDAQGVLLSLLNADRERAGRTPLAVDARLVAAARAHSEDMRSHHVVAHVSPRTGGPADRAKRAGVQSVRITENLAQASTPQLAHQGLMDSPGHRANILDPDVDHVGIGCVMAEPATPGQPRTLVVTQLFAKLAKAAPLSANASADALAHVNTLRLSSKLSSLQTDAALTALAARIAAAPLREKDYDARGGELIQQALPTLAGQFARLRLGMVGVLSVNDFGPLRSFMDPQLTHIGVAVRPFPAASGKDAGSGPRTLVILVLAQKQ